MYDLFTINLLSWKAFAIKMWKTKDISTFFHGIGLFGQNYRPAKQIYEGKWLLKWIQIDEHNAQLTPHIFNQNYIRYLINSLLLPPLLIKVLPSSLRSVVNIYLLLAKPL